MDIEFLLFLQNLREATGGVFDGLFSFVTTWGEAPIFLMVMCTLYLCVDKALGVYLLMGLSLNRIVNGFVKITACVYRPWIRDPRVKPLESAMAKATGYSFPSGHTTNAVATYAGPVMRRGVDKALRVAACVVVALVGLSRNWLGVHTPQDVLVAIVISAALMLLAQKLCDMVDEHPERDAWIAAAGVALAGALVAYAALKSYPMEYNDQGELIVDPVKMANDTYKNAGWALGFFVGWLLERRFVGYVVQGSVSERVCRGIWGMLGVLVLYYPVAEAMKTLVPGAAGSIIANALQTLFVVLVMPLIITLRARRHGRA